VKGTLALPGLVFFRRVFDAIAPSPWLDWRLWPHLNLAIDHAGDGLCATAWLKMLKLNLTVWGDFSHGGWNDVKGMLRDCDLFPFWLIWMIVLNIPYGPHEDDPRYNQINDAWNECRRFHTAKTCVVFNNHVVGIVNDYGGRVAILEDMPEGFTGDAEDAAWIRMKEESPMRRAEYRVNLNRFYGGTKRSRQELGKWHARLVRVCCHRM
jgi:hypothetical protein